MENELSDACKNRVDVDSSSVNVNILESIESFEIFRVTVDVLNDNNEYRELMTISGIVKSYNTELMDNVLEEARKIAVLKVKNKISRINRDIKSLQLEAEKSLEFISRNDQ